MLVSHWADIDIEAPLADFKERGYARLGRVLEPDGVAALAARSNELMLGERSIPGLFYQHDSSTGRYEDLEFGAGWVGPSLRYRKLEKLELDLLFLAWIENPLFARIAHAVLGRDVTLYRAVLWNKAAHAGMALPWHQDDGAFWGIDRPPSLQIWTALDPAPREAGCVEFVPASHHAGLATELGGTVPPDQLEAEDAERRAVPVPVEAGEALLIHNHVWHRSGPNSTATPRRGIGLSFLSGDTRCKRKKRKPRVFHPVFRGA
ncbi:MAG: phytanoyl-CoA dioxygenase family protein [Myxococcota bacterium]|jgi:hypothetical protein|nr:phytanoyl-CoA dioxygenase family protein [Myxococcota bacterium]